MPPKKRKTNGEESLKFRDKLLLNQWLLRLFGIDPLEEQRIAGEVVRPFRKLADPIRDSRHEGIDADNLHIFCKRLIESEIYRDFAPTITREQLLSYDENIVHHTLKINEHRDKPIVWKYYQWLTLLFVEIYLDRYFTDRDQLLTDLNGFVTRSNSHWNGYRAVPDFSEDDLNKLCIQNATGSGKTLMMHLNLMQYRYHASQAGKRDDLNRTILITPNDRLSEQHLADLATSGIPTGYFGREGFNLFTNATGTARVDVLEITKLADKDGPNTIATRSLGDRNLLLVDEGHRGMSGKDEGVWFERRQQLCAKGFTFEYSATFEQAVRASGSIELEDKYAKSVIFDYSFRWFYEDGFGKDYRILNLPNSDVEETTQLYMTACLLKFYQQLRVYEDLESEFKSFNVEKPLWIFVGSSVSTGKLATDEVATDVARIILFIARFLEDREASIRRIKEVLFKGGQSTGLLDQTGKDIFNGTFDYLLKSVKSQDYVGDLYKDILGRLFNHAAGGRLELDRIKGDSGEIALRLGSSEEPFGLINVGDAKKLCDHLNNFARSNSVSLTVGETDFLAPIFNSVKESSSPINLLIGAKKFIEGWDFWRVSTMGLMHVGKSEGSQIIQLFGRGVRLKGFGWSLKRSSHVSGRNRPLNIGEVETLNVFGVESKFMENFRQFLKDEGLPGNEHPNTLKIPLIVDREEIKGLKIVRQRTKSVGNDFYDFRKDAAVPTVGEIPDYLRKRQIVSDWYPRIQAIGADSDVSGGGRIQQFFEAKQLALLDFDEIYLELERFKRDRGYFNLNISKTGIRRVLDDRSWYKLFVPAIRFNPTDFVGVRLVQRIAIELLRRYCDQLYKYRRRSFLEPRLELRYLSNDDENLPSVFEYSLVFEEDPKTEINVKSLNDELAKSGEFESDGLSALNFSGHLFRPLFLARRNGKIKVHPFSLGESEFKFVADLKKWVERKENEVPDREIYLLRNQSRGKGIGFFEAGNFHPDFILWIKQKGKQYVTFIEPHGLIHEGPQSEKILFRDTIRAIESRLSDPNVVLNSFVLSWTSHKDLNWGKSMDELEHMHVLLMQDQPESYIAKLVSKILSGK